MRTLWLLLAALAATGMARKPVEPPCPPVAPGAIAFWSAPEAVTAALGPPSTRWVEDPWRVSAHRRCDVEATIYFQREHLGRARLRFAAPIDDAEAARWARALVPSVTEKALAEGLRRGVLHQALTLDTLPFEAELRFMRRAGGVAAIEGDLAWLD